MLQGHSRLQGSEAPPEVREGNLWDWQVEAPLRASHYFRETPLAYSFYSGDNHPVSSTESVHKTYAVTVTIGYYGTRELVMKT